MLSIPRDEKMPQLGAFSNGIPEHWWSLAAAGDAGFTYEMENMNYDI